MPFTEDEAKAWLTEQGVSRETFLRLDQFYASVALEQVNQNLVSAKTLPAFWSRHIVDAAQLIAFTENRKADWLDVGSGAGIPGIVTALLTAAPTRLIEPRKRRAGFLRAVVNALKLDNVDVIQSEAERVKGMPASVITARAVAALPTLVAMAAHLADEKTLWIMPKGRSAKVELESLPATWQGDWTMHRSITDADSFILVGRNVRIERES